MKKIALFLLAFSMGCKSNRVNEFAEIIRKHHEEDAFKKNEKVKFYELNVLYVDTVNQLSVDSEYLNRVSLMIDHYTDRMTRTLSVIKSNIELARLYKETQESALFRNTMDEIHEYMDKNKVYQDSSAYYFKLDSSIRAKMKAARNSETVFRARTFLKATEYSKTDSSNTLDTLFYFFDKEKKIIDLRKLPTL